MKQLLILADDLSGAADCAASAGFGLQAVLALGAHSGDTHPQVLSIDADTRGMSAQQAAETVAGLVRRYAAGNEVLLFKKIDSTLRGHLGVELAAALEAHRTLHDRTVAVMAPAFPAIGRTTIDGLQHMHGQPLHEHEIWRLHAMPGSAHIPEMLSEAGLQCTLLSLSTIRASNPVLEDAMRSGSNHTDVLVCDAETEDDLNAIASASMRLQQQVIWVGSAGLARHLADAAGLEASETLATRTLPKLSGPLLFVIGSLSRRSIEQVHRLASSPEMMRLAIPPEVLLAEPESAHWHEYQRRLMHSLAMQQDVVIGPASEVHLPLSERPHLAAALARMTVPASNLVGGLIASGGETARNVLDGWGVTELRLLGELERGVPVSVANNWSRELTIMTKAGDFGGPETLLHCRQFLHGASPSLSPAGEKSIR